MDEILKPADADETRDVVAWAADNEAPLEIVGGGSKRALGRPIRTNHLLDLSGLTGIDLYEPEELVMSAAPGTPLAEVEAALADRRQQLAFEPPDYGPLVGGPEGAQTIGGVFACNLSGPRRLKSGAARDHILGFRALSGRGEAFKSGGRVVKNVTGYDLSKLMTGSYGTLGVLTALAFKILPMAEKTRTLLIYGLDDGAATRAMIDGVGSPYDVSGAAHLPADAAASSAVDHVSGPGTAVTALRVEGPAPSVVHRLAALRERLARHGALEELHGTNSVAFWREVRDVAPFVARPERIVWKVSVSPTAGAEVAAAVAAEIAGTQAFYDWGGGLVWLALPSGDEAGHAVVRAAVDRAGGHATLIRAPAEIRERVPVFHPQPPALARLTARLKEGFDPRHVLNPGRMYDGV